MTTPTALLTEAEIAAVRRPYRAARLLPGRAYHDPAFYAFERERFFGRDWQVVGRDEDVPAPGSYILAAIDDEPLIVVRGRDDVVRAFYNVCQHRGTAVAEEPCGTVVRLQCPYHAWIYDLEGNLVRAKHTDDLAEFDFGSYGLRPVRLSSWGGFLFADAGRGRPVARGPAGRPRRSLRPVRPGLPALGAHRRPTRSTRTGSSSPRTTASATTARGSTPS